MFSHYFIYDDSFPSFFLSRSDDDMRKWGHLVIFLVIFVEENEMVISSCLMLK
jgi:hypothetical protein